MAALATTPQDDHPEVEASGVRQACTSLLSSDGVDHRLERQKAVQFLREAENNRRQIEKLEKEKMLSVQCRKNGWTDLSGELDDYEKVLEQERNAEKLHLQMQLVKIHNGVRKFQRHLIDVKPTPELIERLKKIMSEVEISINTLKEEQRSCYEEFLKEERISSQEIAAYEKKIENWSLAVKPNLRMHTAPSMKPKLLDRDLPAEVRALEAFLHQTGGQYGGWDQFDHQAFMKVWNKHSGKPVYRKEAKLYLPGKTLEEIEQHEDWHRELLCLQGKKREAIQRWKAGKNQERLNRIQDQVNKEEAERREKEAKREQHRTEEEKRELALRLEAWREEKKRREEQEEEQRLAEKIQKQRREKEERRRQLEVKMTLEEQLRVRREEEEEQEWRRREKEQREKEERRKEATKCIKHFSERDLHNVEVRIHEKRLREQEEEERQKRITAKLKEKMDGHVNRDPSRLTRPTKGWQERMKHLGPSEDAGPSLQMFHRAVPTWRQGL
ncbi:coiled-coil domain-containing protein 112 [Salarias fasciatus]|uniref:coiled-coil domain-containing protein 112 n=1 Tax=Salarias fasciatus TaxID=181472 RepID=UPI001176A1E5|nr:coiled-coil domain-containing protein 112 [Salarias fasciatus]